MCTVVHPLRPPDAGLRGGRCRGGQRRYIRAADARLRTVCQQLRAVAVQAAQLQGAALLCYYCVAYAHYVL